MGVGKGADDAQKEQGVEEKTVRRHLLIEQAGAEDHQQKIEQLSPKYRDDFPEDGDYIGEHLQPSDLIQPLGQQALEQRDLFEGVQDAVDPVGVLQGKGEPERLIHRSPPAVPR